VTIADPNSTVLPPGWSGTGADNPNGHPILPPGQTFASVLQNVDSINFTTFEPGFFFGDTNFDLSFAKLRAREQLRPFMRGEGADRNEAKSFLTAGTRKATRIYSRACR
jgi:hypothetical protein